MSRVEWSGVNPSPARRPTPDARIFFTPFQAMIRNVSVACRRQLCRPSGPRFPAPPPRAPASSGAAAARSPGPLSPVAALGLPPGRAAGPLLSTGRSAVLRRPLILPPAAWEGGRAPWLRRQRAELWRGGVRWFGSGTGSGSGDRPQPPAPEAIRGGGGRGGEGMRSEKLGSIVEKLPRSLREGHLKDLVSIYGVAVLFAAITLAPFVVEKMKQSTNYYEDVEVDDAVRHAVDDVLLDLRGTDIDRALGLERGLRAADGEGGEDRAVGNIVSVVSDVLNSEALQSAIASLITRVVQSQQFQGACQTLLKTLWEDLVNDPETTAQVVQLLNNAIQNEEVKRSVRRLVLQLIADEEVYREFTNLVVRLGEDDEVLAATQALLTESAHKALNDPEILDHSMEFATDVVGDDIVQRTSGEALRNTVGYAVQPGFSAAFAFAGIALVFVSFSALGNLRTSAGDDEVLGSALGSPAVLEWVGRVQARAFELLTLPGNVIISSGREALSLVFSPFCAFVSAGGSALSLAVSPFSSLASAAKGLYRTGGSMISPMANLPGEVLRQCSSGFSQCMAPAAAVSHRVAAFMSTSANSISAFAQGLASAALNVVLRFKADSENALRPAVAASLAVSRQLGKRLVESASRLLSVVGRWSSTTITSLANGLSWLRGFWRRQRGHI